MSQIIVDTIIVTENAINATVHECDCNLRWNWFMLKNVERFIFSAALSKRKRSSYFAKTE